jgi:predicted nucleic acid-binding protein
MRKAVLLDTSFFLRFLNESDSLFKNADGYYKYLILEKFDLVISTISIAEYCSGGNISELPLRNLQILPFNLNHGKRTGEFAKVAYQARRNKALELKERLLIPNDTKLFAQADSEDYIQYYLSSDSESKKVFDVLNASLKLNFKFIDLNFKHTQTFQLLDL